MKLFKCPPTDLRCHRVSPDDYLEVNYAVSQTYNGGISIDGEWYDGYEVPPPLLPEGHVIVGIGVGLELNACPPLATGVLKRVEDVGDRSYMGSDGVWRRPKIKEALI